MRSSKLSVPTVPEQLLAEISDADTVGKALGNSFADALEVFRTDKAPMADFLFGLGPKMRDFGKAGHAALLESMSREAFGLLAARGSDSIETAESPVIEASLMKPLLETARESGFFAHVHVSALICAVSTYGAVVLSGKVDKQFKQDVDARTARALVLAASSHDERALTEATRFVPAAVSYRFFGSSSLPQYGPDTTAHALGKIWSAVVQSDAPLHAVIAGVLNSPLLQKAVELGLVQPLPDEHPQATALEQEVGHVTGPNKMFLLEGFLPADGNLRLQRLAALAEQGREFVDSATRTAGQASQPQ